MRIPWWVLPMILLFMLLAVPPVLASQVGPDPPRGAMETKCVGGPAERLCVGDEAASMYKVLGSRQEKEAWGDEEKGEIIRVFSLNRGRAACWITLGAKNERIKHMKCIGLNAR